MDCGSLEQAAHVVALVAHLKNGDDDVWLAAVRKKRSRGGAVRTVLTREVIFITTCTRIVR